MLFLAGDLTQLHLPVGMKKLNLDGCRRLTGKAQLIKMSEGLKEKVLLKTLL